MPAQAHKRHAVRRVVERVIGTPWMILPEKMDEIVQLLDLRGAGYELTEEEIAAVVAPRAQRDEDDLLVSGNTAVVKVYGTLFPKANLLTRFSGGTSTEQLQQLLTQAANDPKIERIVLDIDSPGGSAIGNIELVEKIRDVRRVKPVIASVNGMAASAAFWIATAAEKIYASPSSMIGSLGVLIVHRESSRADEEAGIKFTVLKAGQFKADGNDREPLSEQSRATLEERINAYYDQFLSSVAANRNISERVAESQFGQGKVFLAGEALRRNMIDEIATLEQLLSRGSGSPSSATAKENDMDLRLKAALYARGIIPSMDSSDEVCEAAANAWFASRGIERPTDVAEAVAAVNNPYGTWLADVGTLEPAELRTSDPDPDSNDPPPAAGGDGASVTDVPRTDDEIRADERFRIAEIRAIAEGFGDVPSESIQDAIDNGMDPGRFASLAARLRAANVQPVNTPITPGEAQADRFNNCAIAALETRLGFELEGTPDTAGLENRRLIDLARTAMGAYNIRVPRHALDSDVAGAFLMAGGDTPWVPGMTSGASNDPAYHGSGSFPNIMSVLANKMLDRGMMIAETTYGTWTDRLPDAPDFKPKTIVAIGEFNRLPEHKLGRPFEHSDTEEAVSWIQVKSYGDEFVLTPDMIVNDDLDAMMQAMRQKGTAHELTLNALCLNHLLSDPRVADGQVMFHASHNNAILSGSGGAPSSTQLDEMRKLHRAQKGISGREYLRYDARYVLVGPVWETQVEQTLASNLFPATEDAVNTFRGRYTPVVEPMMQDASNANQWFTVVDPRMVRGIVHVFQTGYGRGGRRRSYTRNETQCRHFQIEGRFATSAVNHQAIVSNYGS